MPNSDLRVIHLAQAAAIGTLLAILRLLPLSWAAGTTSALARALGPRLRAHQVMRTNLTAAFPTMSETDINRISREVWDNLGRNLSEWAHVHQFLTGRLVIDGAEHLHMAMREHGRFILFSAHMANWEMTAIATYRLGARLATVYRASSNPWMNRLVARQRHLYSAEQIPKGRSGARRILEVLKAGRPLGILIDQKLNEGLPIPFFGRTAMTAPALAELGLRWRCPLLPIRIVRLPQSHFRVTIEPPLPFPETGTRKTDTTTLMTNVNALLECWIREEPGQWFWVHHRWRD